MKVAEQKNRELSDVKAKYLERQKQADNYKRRVDVIDQLRASQTVSGEPAEHGRRHGQRHRRSLAEQHEGPGSEHLNFEGMALSTDAVANLIANLQKTGFFKNIEIKETYQDEQ